MGRDVPTTDEPCDVCKTTDNVVYDFMGDLICSACMDKQEGIVVEDVIDDAAGSGITFISPLCTDCGIDGFLVSENGTDDCESWRCIRCHIRMVVREEVSALGIKDLVKETITEAVTKAFADIKAMS